MQRKYKRICAVALAVSSLGLCACMKERKIVSAEISKDYVQKVQPNEKDITQDFTLALTRFSFQLFNYSFENKQENYLISPLSAYLCLSLITNGASGKTEKSSTKKSPYPRRHRD